MDPAQPVPRAASSDASVCFAFLSLALAFLSALARLAFAFLVLALFSFALAPFTPRLALLRAATPSSYRSCAARHAGVMPRAASLRCSNLSMMRSAFWHFGDPAGRQFP